MAFTMKQLKTSVQYSLKWLQQDNFKSSELLTADQVPFIHREPFILTGYRQVYRPWKYYIHSLLHLHNETFNVWTHAVGFFLVLVRLIHLLSDYDVINDKMTWPVLLFGVCCLVSLILSAVAHSLHSKSPWHHYALFLLDYAGIAIHSYGIGVASICVSSSRRFQTAHLAWYLPANLFFSWFTFFMFCITKTRIPPNDRRRVRYMLFSLVVNGVFVFSPVALRYSDCLRSPECSLASLNPISIVVLLDGLSAITYGALVPERFMPGSFDIFGHSHQLFHVIVVANAFVRFWALEVDIKTKDMASREILPSSNYMFLSSFILIIIYVVTFIYYLRFVKYSSNKRSAKEKSRR